MMLLCGAALALAGCGGTKEWREVQPSVLPQLMPGNNKKQAPLVYTEISRDIDVGYVIDREKSYDFIMQDSLAAWEIDAKTLHKTAMRNLEKLAETTEIQFADSEETPGGRYAIIETSDGYAAARILSEEIRKKMREYLGEEYVAAVPVRDFLIFWHKDFPLAGQFMEQVEKEYAAEEIYRLTPRLFLITDEGMTPLTKKPLN